MASRISSPELESSIRALSDFPHPWWVAGGWALDMARGEITREHHDVDLCVLREHVADLLAHFQGWEVFVAVPGEHRLVPCTTPDDILPPRHELHMHHGEEKVEILLIERDGDHIVFRRDPRIRYPLSDFTRRDPQERPYVPAEWQLLFKAKHARDKDHQDFHTHRPSLSPEAATWLLNALRLHLPDSPWIPLLAK
jgi:hypothetical protein